MALFAIMFPMAPIAAPCCAAAREFACCEFICICALSSWSCASACFCCWAAAVTCCTACCCWAAWSWAAAARMDPAPPWAANMLLTSMDPTCDGTGGVPKEEEELLALLFALKELFMALVVKELPIPWEPSEKDPNEMFPRSDSWRGWPLRCIRCNGATKSWGTTLLPPPPPLLLLCAADDVVSSTSIPLSSSLRSSGAPSRRAWRVLSRAFFSPMSPHSFVLGSCLRNRPGGFMARISS
mmetsp:Transcript_6235/g.12083  ORF Transcript_6235/g.12083 Transcript_6235/m.12083 type:complete len:240 (-) Transcript_6235:119-838(-)